MKDLTNNKTTFKMTSNIKRNFALLLMILPGAIWLIIFKYLPMFGVVIAFKDFRYFPGGFINSLLKSDWVGFDNFKFLFSSSDAFIIVRNTIGYNAIFILTGTILSVAFAIMLNEMTRKKLSKVYQTSMFFPYFLSWVIVSYFVYIFLSLDKGIINNILVSLGMDKVSWYSEPGKWPLLLIFINNWKNLGYSIVFYLAAICGIDKAYYEAAMLDGATKWQQIKHITLPHLKPMIITLTILAIGRIFSADFGLFFNVPKESGPLFPVTNVIDTYVYRGLIKSGDVGMSTAAGLFQSAVGFILIMITNGIVKKVDKENAIF
ncbi:sugar ABC transporter permease [Vallitalea sediminicola]